MAYIDKNIYTLTRTTSGWLTLPLFQLPEQLFDLDNCIYDHKDATTAFHLTAITSQYHRCSQCP